MEAKKSNISELKKIVDTALNSLSDFTYPKCNGKGVQEAELRRDEIEYIISPKDMQNAINSLGEAGIKTDPNNEALSKLLLLHAMLEAINEAVTEYIENININYRVINNIDEDDEMPIDLQEVNKPPEVSILNILNTWMAVSDFEEMNKIIKKFLWSMSLDKGAEKLLKSTMIKWEFLNALNSLSVSEAIDYIQKACEYLPDDTYNEKVRKNSLKNSISEIVRASSEKIDKDKDVLKGMQRQNVLNEGNDKYLPYYQ